MISGNIALDPFTKTTGGGVSGPGSTGTTTKPPSTVRLAPEACANEADCIANNWYWWQEGLLAQPKCHNIAPEWYQTGQNQLMMLAGTIGILAAIGIYWYFLK